jgi:membrane protein YqaA with SNARE-associated domain
MSLSVVCLAKSYDAVESIIKELRSIGIRNDDVSVLFPDTSTTQAFAHEMHTKAPEGAAAGASTGGVLGGALGWLVGMGTIAIPGVGPFIAAGPILAALSGAAIGAAVGGVTGCLVGLGIPEIEAKRYEGRIKEGRILIAVSAAKVERADEIEAVLKNSGAEDIATTTASQVVENSKDKRSDKNCTTVLEVPKAQKGRSAKS